MEKKALLDRRFIVFDCIPRRQWDLARVQFGVHRLGQFLTSEHFKWLMYFLLQSKY